MSAVTERLNELDGMMEYRIERIEELKAEIKRAQKIMERNPEIIAKFESELSKLGTEFRRLRAIEKGGQELTDKAWDNHTKPVKKEEVA